MRVVVITGKAPHQKDLCVKLVQAHDVVGVIHPDEAPARSSRVSIRKLMHEVRQEGLSLVLLHLLKILPGGHADSKSRTEGKLAALPDFSKAAEDYARLPKSLIHVSCDVKSSETRALLRSLRPEVTVCLGGPVYPKALIESSPLMLNFHSGVSPLYNGTSSIRFAFANGHLFLCGGTLMVMSADVDGGAILGHYLPAIQSGDSPETLFQKTVGGAAGMYSRLLDSLEAQPRQLTPIPQPRPLFYTRGVEFGWYHKVMTARNCRINLAAHFSREEKIVEYWRAPNYASALCDYRKTLETLLWDSRHVDS